MPISRMVTPEIVRLPLSGDDWIEVKRELSVGEARGFMYGTLVEVVPGSGVLKRDIERTLVLKILTYVTAWSFADPEGRPIPTTETGLNALTANTMEEILDAINTHDRRVALERLAVLGKNGQRAKMSRTRKRPTSKASTRATSPSAGS